MKIRLALVLMFLALAVLAQPPSSKPNVVLITIDTLRADRLGCYGYTKAQTPHLDRIASEGILFTNAISHVPLTRPSHASIFTGLYPFQHRIHDNIASPLDSKIPTLAETLKSNGYRTAGFVASFVINSQSGLQRGFDTYDDRFDPKNQPTDFAMNLEKRGSEILEEFQNWKSQGGHTPYFAWLHFYDPHFPYSPPTPYSKSFAERPYDGEVAYTDELIGKTLQLLDKNTLLIVTSDHGESLGDHGENAHSYFIYDATLQVPLIFYWPEKIPANQKVVIQARSIDLYPTILDLIAIKQPSKVSGISLKPWLNKQPPADPGNPSYSETFTPWLHFGWNRLIGVRQNGWKYIEAPRAELYHLAIDPGELKNLYSQQKSRALQMKQWLSKSGAFEEKPATSASQELDSEMLEKLASLGYAGGGVTVPHSGRLADPKDKLGDFKLFNRLIREGIEDFQQQRYSQAASKFQTLRDRKIPSFEVHYYLGRSLLLLKSYDKSSTELGIALQKLPHFLPAYRDLAEAEEGRKRPEQAEKVLLQGLKISPGHPTVSQPLAWLYQRQKRFKDAERVLLEELKKFPDDPEGMYRLASIYRDTQRPDQALVQLQQIVKKYPKEAEAHNQIGMIYGAQKKNAEAFQAFTTAAKLAPNDEHIRKNLEVLRTQTTTEPSTVRFRIIQTRTRAVAETILRKLQQGEAWDELARNYSIHPSARSSTQILETSIADLDPSLQQSLDALKSGQISNVIESSTGFFLVKKE